MRCKTTQGEMWIFLTERELRHLLGAFDVSEASRLVSVPGGPYVITDLSDQPGALPLAKDGL